MKVFKISSYIWLIIFIIGALFLWFRKTDGAGVPNTMTYRLVSLGMWLFLFLLIFIAYLIWHRYLKKKKALKVI